MGGCVGLVDWPIADTYHEVVTCIPCIRHRSGKVRQLKTDVLATELRRSYQQDRSKYCSGRQVSPKSTDFSSTICCGLAESNTMTRSSCSWNVFPNDIEMVSSGRRPMSCHVTDRHDVDRSATVSDDSELVSTSNIASTGYLCVSSSSLQTLHVLVSPCTPQS